MLCVLEHLEFVPGSSPRLCQEPQKGFQDDLSGFLSPLSCDLDFEAMGGPAWCHKTRNGVRSLAGQPQRGGAVLGAAVKQHCGCRSIHPAAAISCWCRVRGCWRWLWCWASRWAPFSSSPKADGDVKEAFSIYLVSCPST